MTAHARRITTAVALLAALATTGCLEKETTNTFCLEPDGAVRWTVLVREVHAVAETAAARLAEENEFLAKVRAGEHDEALALRALGGAAVTTELVSSEWPYAVHTEARFPDIATLWQRYFRLMLGIEVRSALTREGDRTTWTMVIDSRQENAEAESETAALHLLESGKPPSFFIRDGRFVAASGFELDDDDGRRARLIDLDEHDWDAEPVVTLSLTWVAKID